MTALELDFAPELEGLHDHVFTILSLEGCGKCDELYAAMEDAHRLISAETKVPILVRKIDCTADAKGNKSAFIAKLVKDTGYVPRKDGKVFFPIVIHNDSFLGGYREGYGRFCTVVDQYL